MIWLQISGRISASAGYVSENVVLQNLYLFFWCCYEGLYLLVKKLYASLAQASLYL